MPEGEQTARSHPRPRRRRLRLWTLLLIAAGCAAGAAWIWMAEDLMRQARVERTVFLAAATVLLLAGWLLLLSGWRWPARLGVLAGLVALGGLAAGLVRVEGVSGDLVPIVSWRWSASSGGADLPGPSAAPSSPSEAPMPGLADFPQFLGPGRDAVVEAVALDRDWSARPPRLLWRRPVGAGWSAFAIAGRRAVTHEQRGGEETIVCYDVATGDVLWAHGERARYDNPVAGVGPRATPTIDGGDVFAMGSTGVLVCVDLETGASRWTTDAVADSGGAVPDWGLSVSPLVAGGLVIVSAGGTGGPSLTAYDRTSGGVAWRGGGDPCSYSSPVLADLVGRRQVLIVNAQSFSGHDPAGGALLWRQEWPGETPKVAQPVVLAGDTVFVSAGYGVGGVAVRLAEADGRLTTELLWRTRHMKAKFTNVVPHGGFLYGLDDGTLACIDAETGRRQWKDGRYGHGQVILAGDLLLVQAEDGDVALVEPVPEERRELTRFAALDGKTWNCPALAGRYLLVRNDREAACYELPVEE